MDSPFDHFEDSPLDHFKQKRTGTQFDLDEVVDGVVKVRDPTGLDGSVGPKGKGVVGKIMIDNFLKSWKGSKYYFGRITLNPKARFSQRITLPSTQLPNPNHNLSTLRIVRAQQLPIYKTTETHHADFFIGNHCELQQDNLTRCHTQLPRLPHITSEVAYITSEVANTTSEVVFLHPTTG